VNGVRYKDEGGRCINCHSGSEFTDASITSINRAWNGGSQGSVTRVREGQFIDRGFNNIGVRPTFEDLGVGATDALAGSPLSATRRCANPDPSLPAPTLCAPVDLNARYVAADGAFKAPGLRNVELTAPYFHNGGQLTLESLVQFYSRGGDFGCSKAATKQLGDDVTAKCEAIAGEQPLVGMDGGEIRPLSIPGISSPQPGFSAQEQSDLVAFLKSLTDERVRYHRAPFDHPQLFVPNGQYYDNVRTMANPLAPAQALDRFIVVPAVGAAGYKSPLAGFLGY
jgi:cytochrome c peroxidase